MKTFLQIYLTSIITLFISKSNFAQAANWEWANSGGSVSNDYSNSTCTDLNGNVYQVGTFQGSTVTFGSNTLTNNATGSLDIFVVKYDASGNVLWAKSAGGTFDDYAYGICTDKNGHIYITGYFNSDTISFGALTLINAYTAGTSGDVYIAKYDTSGNEIWAQSAKGASNEISFGGICSDVNNNISITGFYQSPSLIFGNDTLVTSGGLFIAKYDSVGNCVWAKSFGGPPRTYGLSICNDAIGNLYVTGVFGGANTTIGSNTIIGSLYGTAYVAKFDDQGDNIWAKAVPFLSLNAESRGNGIAVDSAKNVYITGYFKDVIALGDTLGNAGNKSVFLAKYDSSGNVQWGRSPGGTLNDYGNSICTDANGNVFFTGYFSSSLLNFGGFPVINNNSGNLDIFIAAYSANGNALWATGVGGQDNDFGMGICSSPDGAIYSAGYFGSSSLNFGNATVTNNGSYDAYLAKITMPVGIDELFPHSDNSKLHLYPNPTLNSFSIKCNLSSERSLLRILNPFGNIIYSEELFGRSEHVIHPNLSPGIYFITLNNGVKSLVGKLIVE